MKLKDVCTCTSCISDQLIENGCCKTIYQTQSNVCKQTKSQCRAVRQTNSLSRAIRNIVCTRTCSICLTPIYLPMPTMLLLKDASHISRESKQTAQWLQTCFHTIHEITITNLTHSHACRDNSRELSPEHQGSHTCPVMMLWHLSSLTFTRQSCVILTIPSMK